MLPPPPPLARPWCKTPHAHGRNRAAPWPSRHRRAPYAAPTRKSAQASESSDARAVRASRAVGELPGARHIRALRRHSRSNHDVWSWRWASSAVECWAMQHHVTHSGSVRWPACPGQGRKAGPTVSGQQGRTGRATTVQAPTPRRARAGVLRAGQPPHPGGPRSARAARTGWGVKLRLSCTSRRTVEPRVDGLPRHDGDAARTRAEQRPRGCGSWLMLRESFGFARTCRLWTDMLSARAAGDATGDPVRPHWRGLGTGRLVRVPVSRQGVAGPDGSGPSSPAEG
jgi:hypothetical protein